MREQWKAWEQRARTQAQRAGNGIIDDFNRTPFIDAMSAIYEKSLSDAKVKQLVERMRQAE
jgi:TRAP-type C4-dicarboxylate transport system substrate-binding protein